MKIIVSENQFRYLKKNTKSKNNIHSSLNEEWWNTVGDIAGLLDPTGVVDFINGLDYIRQGNYFFGMLSMISAVPYIGDMVAKPLMLTGKVSKGLDTALKIAKNAKTADDMIAAKRILHQSSQSNILVRKLLDTANVWGPKVKGAIESAIPAKYLTGGLKKTITDWIDLFTQAAQKGTNLRMVTAKMAKQASTDPATAKQLVASIQKLQKYKTGPFSTFQLKDPDFMLKYVWPTVMMRTSKNRQLIGLMRRTKFYAGFLDYMGLGNFVGPQELERELGTENFQSSFQEYLKTPQAAEYYRQDFESIPDQQGFGGTGTNQTSIDPIDAFFDELFT